MRDNDVYIVDGLRTPMGRYGGALSSVRPDDLAALVVGEVLARSGVPGYAVDEVVLGAANQAGEDNRNVARMAALLAGLPPTVPGYTVNRLCASGLTAIASAANAIRCGESDVVVAGGVESMTRAPWVVEKPGTPWAKPGHVFDTALGWRLVNPTMATLDDGLATLSMGETAEEVAALDGISREDSDAYALLSQQRAAAARDGGRLTRQIIPVTRSGADPVTVDECPRETSMARLGALRPAFREAGVVTAGSSSPLSDGATALVLASADAVRRHGLRPRARVVGAASAGVAPHLMGLGPVAATTKLLPRLGLTVEDLEAVELNEAFAVQVLACQRRLGLDPDTVNADGGAIALGHPLGSSGARLVVSLIDRLERSGGRRGLATLCVGVGQGVAMVVERV